MNDYKVGDTYRAPKNENAVYMITKVCDWEVKCVIDYGNGKMHEWSASFNRMAKYIRDGDLVPSHKAPRELLPEELFCV